VTNNNSNKASFYCTPNGENCVYFCRRRRKTVACIEY